MAEVKAEPRTRDRIDVAPRFTQADVIRLNNLFRGQDADGIAAKTKEYEDRFANPFVAAAKGFIDEVIYPHSTRRRIALGLRKLRNKQLENPWKKHDNIPL